MSTALEVLFLLLLIVANGIFSMSELAVVSARRARLQGRADEGDRGAQVALRLADQPTRFLSTVQVGITLIGTVAGAFGGATLAEELAKLLARIPGLESAAGTLAFVLVVALISYLSLVIGELVPKRLALNNPERVAARIARPMRLLSLLAAPLVRLLTASTNLVVRLLGVRAGDEPPITEDELLLLVEQGRQAGIFAASEQGMIEQVLRLDNRRIGGLMTPRPEIIWLDVSAPPEDNWRKIHQYNHACYPVGDDDLDNLLGLVSLKALWQQTGAGQLPDLRAAVQEAIFVPENATALGVLGRFKTLNWHMLLVVNEFGGIEGLVTPHDILEAIVGSITGAGDAADLEIVVREDGSWLLDGLLPVEELKALLGLDRLPDETPRHYQTLGGFVMHQLGRIPHEADHFDAAGWRFEVMDMDSHRVDRVLVSRASAEGHPMLRR